MAVELKSRRGKALKLTDEHWSVFLNVAQAHGWKPAGTLAPVGWPGGEVWPGQYASSDGQRVSDDDARAMARVLYEAATGDGVARSLRDVIDRVELAAKRSGASLRPEDRMAPRDFYDEFSPLLLLLYDGEFAIC